MSTHDESELSRLKAAVEEYQAMKSTRYSSDAQMAPTKTPAIAMLCAELEKNISGLTELVSALEARLEPIMRTHAEVLKEASNETESHSAHGKFLTEQNTRLRVLGGHLRDLLSALEL